MARRVRRVVSRLVDVVHEGQVTYGARVSGPRSVAGILRPLIGDRAQETLVCLLLDGRHRLFGLAEVSVGTLTSSVVHPREVFGPALRLGAAAVVVAHAHPSGDPEPSAEDLAVTRRLIDCGRLLGVPLLDHLVLGGDEFVSLRERIAFG